MRKTLSILLSVVLGATMLVGCGSNKKDTVKEPQKQEQAQEQTESKNEDKEVKNSIPEMKLKTPFQVETEYGNYALTINAIHTTDERNEFEEEQPKQVVLIDYEYKNESFSVSDGQGKLLIDAGAFIAMDGEGNVLRTYPSSIDKLPQAVPVGGKCTATIAYGIPTDSKTVRLQFERNSKPIGEMVVDIK